MNHILCVEDDRGLSELIRRHLSDLEYHVTICPDAESGLKASFIKEFDVILVDQVLPGISGIEFIQKLKQSLDTPPPVIMITGAGDEHLAVQALKSGADDYLVKDAKAQYLRLLPEVIFQVLETHEMQMVQARMALEQAQLIKELQIFNYAVAHDLRQPLAVLSSSLGLIEKYADDGELSKIKEKANRLQISISKMNQTMEALLLFAQARDAKNIDLQLLDMDDLIQNVVEQLSNLIEQHEASIIIPDHLPSALGHAPWVESIWSNYITNAIKYSGVPPRIEINATRQDDELIHYYVKDNGQGLSVVDQEKIFSPFSRLQERKVEGHGLGLAIVRMMAQRLGGSVSLNSTPGKGSIFGFTLMADETT